MFKLSTRVLLSVMLLRFVSAVPIFGIGQTESKDAPTPLNDGDIAPFIKPAKFARVAYCSTAQLTNWTCGGPCDALKGVEFLQAGGDDGLIPKYYIAHDPEEQAIVVAHQGTDPENILSIANDAQILLVDANTTTFPGVPSGAQVHDGFQKTFERTADGVLSGVKTFLASKGANKVVVSGHSLGAAVATMDAMMLRLNLDSSIPVTTTVFGLPREGNQEWADFVDSTLGNTFAHITNQKDPVPIVPPHSLGYQHPSGEVHKSSETDTVACPGQENQNCSDANNVLEASVANHLGPYFQNVTMSASECPS